MSQGFRTRYENRNLQIDENYVNLAFLYKGSVNLGSSSSLGVYTKSFSLSGLDLVVAFRSPNPFSPGGRKENGGNTQFTFSTNVSNSTLSYFVFSKAELGQSFNTNYGIRTRNSSGEVVFDSRKKYLKIIDFQSIDKGANEQLPNKDYGVPVALIYCQWFNDIAIFPSGTPGQYSVRYTYPAMATPNTQCNRAGFSAVYTTTSGGENPYSGLPPAFTYLVVDVSNL